MQTEIAGENINITTVREEKAMAPHSSTLAWTIQGREEAGRLQTRGSLIVRHE